MIFIAEAGVNHNGSIDIAKKLIDEAADANADYVKFQTFRTDALVRRNAQMAEYQKRNLGKDDSQYSMLKALELPPEAHIKLIEHCKQAGIKFLSTAFDLESAKLLHDLGLELWKIPSGEVTNYPLLRQIAQYGGKVLLSTGMCTLDEVKDAVKVLTDNGIAKHDITVLHCNTQYPTPLCDVNLRAMVTLGHELGLDYGYSDHTGGIHVAMAATALGAKVIEKHFTLDCTLPGPDQKASLEPLVFRQMVSELKYIEKSSTENKDLVILDSNPEMFGTDKKIVTDSERENIFVARKSIVAARPIAKGEILTEENLTTKRPATGLSPMLWPQVIGTPAIRDFSPDEDIEI